MTKVNVNIENIIKENIADKLGVSPSDIANEDLLREDLHMNSMDITDLIHNLNESYSLDINKISDIKSVQDIIDLLSDTQEF